MGTFSSTIIANMTVFSVTCLLLGYITVCSAQQSYFDAITCRYIQSRDCFSYGDSPVCGRNGVTYRNKCDFGKVHCKDVSVELGHYGSCNANDTTTTAGTPINPPVTHTPDSVSSAVLDELCTSISHDVCPPDNDQVCGVKGNKLVTYDNACEYQKDKCTHRELHVVNFGACP